LYEEAVSMRCRLAAALIAMALAVPAAAAPGPDAVALERVVDRFHAAREGFDAAALGETLAADYVEISPIGDVDDRARVIGFYRADLRKPAPTIEHRDRQTSIHGTFGIETERLSFTMTRPDGVSISRAVRARYVGVRDGRGWKLVSAQYTPIPPAK
jgi:ketosteroid isomerase-like protein